MRRVGRATLLKYIYNKIENTNKLIVYPENPANQKIFKETNYDRIGPFLFKEPFFGKFVRP